MPECKSPIRVQYSLSLICILHTLNIKQVTQSETEKIGSYQESTTEECLMYESDNKAVSRHGQGCKHNKTNWIKESQWCTKTMKHVYIADIWGHLHIRQVNLPVANYSQLNESEPTSVSSWTVPCESVTEQWASPFLSKGLQLYEMSDAVKIKRVM